MKTDNKKNKKPIYLQLRENIRNKIEEGEYLPGTSIPSENTLAATFGINRITIRNAVDALVNEGLLKRVQGKGVYVVGQKLSMSIEGIGGFISDSLNSNNGLSIKEVLKITRPANNKYANLFDLELDDEIYQIRHIGISEQENIVLQDYFFPVSILPTLDSINTSIFTYKDIFSFYGIKQKKMEQHLTIVKGSSKTRKLLGIPNGIMLFKLECDYYGIDNKVIAHGITYIRGDKQSFTVNLHKTISN